MVYLDELQQRLLKRLAREERAPETEIVRRALDLYARERLDDPLAELIGAFGRGPRDGAAKHDEHLTARRRAR